MSLAEEFAVLEKKIKELQSRHPIDIGYHSAWMAVANTLSEVRPDWTTKPYSGTECAVRTIKEMAQEISDLKQHSNQNIILACADVVSSIQKQAKDQLRVSESILQRLEMYK